MKRTGWIGLAATGLALGLATLPAVAAPSGTRVDEVYQLPCTGAVCDPGDDGNRLVGDGGQVTKDIQVFVRSSASLGFEYVELEARRRNNANSGWDGDWICIKHWGETDATTFAEFHNWDTREWPGSPDNGPGQCPDSSVHGSLTKNGRYALRVVAVEKPPLGAKQDIAQRDQISQPYYISVANKPSVPVWAGDPAVSGESSRLPVVTLQWGAVPQPDVVEYRFVREGPGGNEVEFAVSATNPGGQGCSVSGGTYTCHDDFFPDDGYGGTYTYRLAALRWATSSTGTKCALPPGDHCVRSSYSSSKSTNVTEVPKPSPSGGGTPTNPGSDDPTQDPTPGSTVKAGKHKRSRSASTGSSGSGSSSVRRGSSNADFYTGTYDEELPYGEGRPIPLGPGDQLPGLGDEDGGEILAADSGTTGGPIDERILVSVAAGLIMLVFALHMGRLLRDR